MPRCDDVFSCIQIEEQEYIDIHKVSFLVIFHLICCYCFSSTSFPFEARLKVLLFPLQKNEIDETKR